jgi:threonine/homoserine/homoserine lactone efflux protein
MAEASTPKKSNLIRSFLITFVVIVMAIIIGRTAGGGELDQEFLVQKIIGVGIALAIVYGGIWTVRSRRSQNNEETGRTPTSPRFWKWR